MELRVKKELLEGINPSEIAELAQKLGITIIPEIKKRTGTPRAVATQPYYEITETTCSICGSRVVKMFAMEKIGFCLTSKSVAEVPEFARRHTSKYSTKSCPKCREFIESLEKDVLVELVMELIRPKKTLGLVK